MLWALLHPSFVYQKNHEDYSSKINELRSAGGSRFFYNKSLILVDEFFDFTSYLSPRIYFQAGDGTPLSPNSTEPIAGLLFIFFVFGVCRYLKKDNYKMLTLVFIVGILTYIIGQRKFPFLLPLAILYAFIAYDMVLALSKNKKLTIALVLALNVFLSIRMFML